MLGLMNKRWNRYVPTVPTRYPWCRLFWVCLKMTRHIPQVVAMHKHSGGLFIEPAFSTFAVFVIGFIPQITVVLHLPESSISFKSTRVLLTGNVKNLSGSLFFSALSVLDNVCSELGQVFVGTVFPSPLPRAGGKAFHALFLSPCASLNIPGVHCVQNSSQGFDTNLSWGSARRHTLASHHICEEVQDDIQ